MKAENKKNHPEHEANQKHEHKPEQESAQQLDDRLKPPTEGQQVFGTAAAQTTAETAEQEAEKAVDLSLENQKLREELSELKDQYLRKVADMENFRKRMFREKEEAIRYANAQLLLDVIGLLDDFERAIASGRTSRDFDSFLQGIEMIESQFFTLLERKYGLKRLEPLGEVFNPTLHEAIAGEGADHAVVAEVYQRGYLLHDRVLRPARVRVGSERASGAEADSTPTSETPEAGNESQETIT